jgi:hypothetical protein
VPFQFAAATFLGLLLLGPGLSDRESLADQRKSRQALAHTHFISQHAAAALFWLSRGLRLGYPMDVPVRFLTAGSDRGVLRILLLTILALQRPTSSRDEIGPRSPQTLSSTCKREPALDACSLLAYCV